MPKRLSQAEKDARRRAYVDRQQRQALASTFSDINRENTRRLRAIDDDTWNAALEKDGELQTESDDEDDSLLYEVWAHNEYALVYNRRDWRPLFDAMTNVQKLVHLAKRYALDEITTVRAAIMRLHRRAYESELTIQAAHVGCDSRQGHLTNENILADLQVMARDAAEGIANTYNYDLVIAIEHIRQQNVFANRHYYAKHLSIWEASRDKWKIPQIQKHESGVSRSLAQQHFYQRNRNALGIAVLFPKTAVCPVCQGWIDRKEVALRVALNNPPPYHVNCPHIWHTRPNRVRKEECPMLWMGE